MPNKAKRVPDEHMSMMERKEIREKLQNAVTFAQAALEFFDKNALEEAVEKLDVVIDEADSAQVRMETLKDAAE
jgi:hypothetical protein